MKTKNTIICLGLLLLLLIPFAAAFGISSPYHKSNPLIMYPGETREFSLGLQNMVGGEDMLIEVEIIGGNEIASITDGSNRYQVPFGSSNVPVNLKVVIPADFEVGQEASINVAIKTIPSTEGQMVQIGSSLVKSIPVLIKTESESSPVIPVEAPVIPVEELSAQGRGGILSVLDSIIIILVVLVFFGAFLFLFIKRKKEAGLI